MHFSSVFDGWVDGNLKYLYYSCIKYLLPTEGAIEKEEENWQ